MKDLPNRRCPRFTSSATQVAHGTEFRGYGPASIAASGILALLVRRPYKRRDGKPAKADPAIWLGVWAGTAVVCRVVTALSRPSARAHRRGHVGFARMSNPRGHAFPARRQVADFCSACGE